jgi:hypothetical protein
MRLLQGLVCVSVCVYMRERECAYLVSNIIHDTNTTRSIALPPARPLSFTHAHVQSLSLPPPPFSLALRDDIVFVTVNSGKSRVVT